MVLGALLVPSAVSARGFGSYTCEHSPDDMDAAVAAHLTLRPAVLDELAAARHAYHELSRILRAVRRGERRLRPEDFAALVTDQAEARAYVNRLEEGYRDWADCYDELVRLRRFYPRSLHHLRLSLGFDGSVSRMRNQDDDLAAEYPEIMFRAPSAALQLGWERFYTRRFGLQVNATVAAGQGRMRACLFEGLRTCYGDPPAGGVFTVAIDAGIRVWAAPLLILGLSLELRVMRLPVTERFQNGNRYSVSQQVIPVALVRVGPEVPLSRDGRWWVSPSFASGRMLTQRGFVNAVAVRVGYVL